MPPTVVLDYRFLDSLHLPGLTLVETIVHTPEGTWELVLAGPECGVAIALDDRTVFYGKGEGSVLPNDDLSLWSICAGPGPSGADAHVAYLAAGQLLIEIKAFPESGVTKDQVIEVAASLPIEQAPQAPVGD